MPVYEFHCKDCDRDFEVVERISEYDPKTVKCPKCGGKNVEHLWSRVHAVTSKKS